MKDNEILDNKELDENFIKNIEGIKFYSYDQINEYCISYKI